VVKVVLISVIIEKKVINTPSGLKYKKIFYFFRFIE